MYTTSSTETNSVQPVKAPRENRISRAVDAYDGSIDFDLWLNRVTTSRTDTKKVEKVIIGNRESAFEYLRLIGLSPFGPCLVGEL